MPFTMDIVRGDVGSQMDRTPQRTLGEQVQDTLGRIWSYVRFDTAGSAGQLVRDSVTADLLDSSPTTNAALAAGAEYLSSDAIDADHPGKNLVGALGRLTGDVVGAQQSFVVTDYSSVNIDRVTIKCLSTSTSLTSDDGWGAAVDNGAGLFMMLPGAARVSAAAPAFPRGFLQQSVAAKDIGRYGYVLQRGFGFAIVDQDGTPVPALGKGLVPAAGGLLVGAAASNADGDATVAVGLLPDETSISVDVLFPINARIDNDLKAFALPSYAHPIDEHLVIQ